MEDRVIGKATRWEIHEKQLLHRSVHILVFNSMNQLFLQKRSMSKDENPGLWDTSSAGHVDSGESYDECAHRELWEELHIKGKLKPFAKIQACKETHQEHAQVYFCETDANIQINRREISEGKYFDLPDLLKEVEKKPELFTSSFKLILEMYDEEFLMDSENIL